jgi:N-hydroxyarylamine O-acetyltransferase
MTQIRLDPYLARIGVRRPLRPDLATLTALHAAHVDAIPFEGGDPLLRRPVKLDLDSVQAKLVDGRRGGYCFEQNTLFRAVLEAVGFTVTGLGGRVRWMSPPDSPLGPREHMVLKVDLPDGAFLADVGFGACLLDAPLRLEPGLEQRTAMGTFRLSEADGHYWLAARQPGGWRTMYAFDLQPQIASDFELGNWYTSTSPLAPFTSILIMERLAPGARYKLIDRTFITEARDGEVASQLVVESADAFGRILDEVFNVALPVPPDELFPRLSERGR